MSVGQMIIMLVLPTLVRDQHRPEFFCTCEACMATYDTENLIWKKYPNVVNYVNIHSKCKKATRDRLALIYSRTG